MAAEEGIKNLRLEGHNKVPIFLACWIAGVEYEDNKYKNENYDK